MLKLKEILRILSNAETEFIVVGGVAATLHGSAHLTYDLDICYQRSPENFRRLKEALSQLHPHLRGKGLPPDLPFVFDEKTLEMGLNFTLNTDCGPLDLLGEMEGIGRYENLLEHSEVFDISGVTFRALSLEKLILNKKKVNRIKDQQVLPELEALLELKKQKPD